VLRAVYTFLIEIDPEGNVVEKKENPLFRCSIIKSAEHVDFELLESIITGMGIPRGRKPAKPNQLGRKCQDLFEVVKTLHKIRVRSGFLSDPNLSKSRLILLELEHLTNSWVAQTMLKNNCALLLRQLPPLDEKLFEV